MLDDLMKKLPGREEVRRALERVISSANLVSHEPLGLDPLCSRLIEAAQEEGSGTGEEEEETADPQTATKSQPPPGSRKRPAQARRFHRKSKALGRRMALSRSCLRVLE